MATHSSILAWEIPQRSLAGYSPWGPTESNTTEHTYIHIWYREKKVKSLSRVRFFVTPWTVAYQAPLSMGFSRQGYWSGLPFPSPGDIPNPEIKPGSPALQADALPSELPGKIQSEVDVIKLH